MEPQDLDPQDEDTSIDSVVPDVLADIQDGVVAEGKLISYVNDNLSFL